MLNDASNRIFMSLFGVLVTSARMEYYAIAINTFSKLNTLRQYINTACYNRVVHAAKIDVVWSMNANIKAFILDKTNRMPFPKIAQTYLVILFFQMFSP